MPADLNDRLERFAENEAPDLWDDILARSQNAEVTPLKPLAEDRSPRWFMVAAALLLVVGGAGVALRTMTGENSSPVAADNQASTAIEILEGGGDQADRLQLCLDRLRVIPNEVSAEDPYASWWPDPTDALAQGAVEFLGERALGGSSNIPTETRSTWLLNIGDKLPIVTCTSEEVPGLNERVISTIGLVSPLKLPGQDEVTLSESSGLLVGAAGTNVSRIDLFDERGEMIEAFDRPANGWFLIQSVPLLYRSPSELVALTTEQEERAVWERREVAWSTTDGRYARGPVNSAYDLRFGACPVLENCNRLLNEAIEFAQDRPDITDALVDRHVTVDEYVTLTELADECRIIGEQLLEDRDDSSDDNLFGMEMACQAEYIEEVLGVIDIQTARATAEAKATPS